MRQGCVGLAIERALEVGGELPALADGMLGGGGVGVALGIAVHGAVADGPDVVVVLDAHVVLAEQVAALVAREIEFGKEADWARCRRTR